MNKVKLL